jgi:hypothetical protein
MGNYQEKSMIKDILQGATQSLETFFELDVEQEIAALGQTLAVRKRQNGGRFFLTDHVKGLVLAMLSSERPWLKIQTNINIINEIFFNYDADRIQQELLSETQRQKIVYNMQQYKLGSRTLAKQLSVLPKNIQILKRIDSTNGGIDLFVTGRSPHEIAEKLSHLGSSVKLEQVGFALAAEYLKNVGVSMFKPDRHILRITGPLRLDILPKGMNDKGEVAKFLNGITLKEEIDPTYADNLLWLFGSRFCRKIPQCPHCYIRLRGLCKKAV